VLAQLVPPPGRDTVPSFDRGWLVDNDSREPFLSYAPLDASVNWSDQLEALHEDSSRTHFIDVWTRRAMLDRLPPISTASTILDLGCSTGYLLEDLARTHPEATLVGVDLVAAGLRKAHEAVPAARLLRADACELPLADRTIDAIVSANLLEHVPEDRRALTEMARVLRREGIAVVVVPASPGTYDYYDRFLGHQRRYARGELAAKARDAGLEPLEDCHVGSLIFPAFWLVKQRNRRRYNGLEGNELERRVAANIAGTRDSRVGRVGCTVERLLLEAGIRLPFGIRNLVVLRRC
jgi:ubiquinone/menaquinone biosynthesis C-methylase UbiE